jgi:NADH-quinone oxidoreductase subunit H
MIWGLILAKFILILVVFIMSLAIAAYSTYGERKVAAVMQDRIGPDRAGPWGILQPLADGVKFFMKEDITPKAADKFLFILGPSLFIMTALMTSAVIPWGKSFYFGGKEFNLQIADLNVGTCISSQSYRLAGMGL